MTKDLIDLERGFWSSDPEFYRDHVAEQCLLAFDSEMAGVRSHDAVVESVASGTRWTDVSLDKKGQVEAGSDAAILTYEVHAKREGEPYHALCSSGYVRQDGDWKLAFHQQTPLD